MHQARLVFFPSRAFARRNTLSVSLHTRIKMITGPVLQSVIMIKSRCDWILQSMVLPRPEGDIAGFPQHFPQGNRIGQGLVEGAVVAVLLGIDTGQQTGPGRKTLGGIMKLGKTHAILSQAVDVGGSDLTSVTAQIGPTHIVHADEDDIGQTRFSSTPGKGDQEQNKGNEEAHHHNTQLTKFFIS